MNLTRTFRTEIAPDVFVCTEAKAVIDYHDDGEPCVSVEYGGHHYECRGAVVNPRFWPALKSYEEAYANRRVDPHKAQTDLWADELHEQAELENTEGVEAPMFSPNRDNRVEAP